MYLPALVIGETKTVFNSIDLSSYSSSAQCGISMLNCILDCDAAFFSENEFLDRQK